MGNGPKPWQRNGPGRHHHCPVAHLAHMVSDRDGLGKPFRMSLASLSLCHATAKWQTVRGMWCKPKANAKNKTGSEGHAIGLQNTYSFNLTRQSREIKLKFFFYLKTVLGLKRN